MKTTVISECGSKDIQCDFLLDLDKADVKDCLGCWTCWLKKPGRCAYSDLDEFYKAFLSADKVILFSKVKQGFVSGKMKTLFDRMIPLYLPYITYKSGESMHYPRYERYPEIEVYYEGEFETEEERKIYIDYMHRLCYQFLCKCDVVKPISEYQDATGRGELSKDEPDTDDLAKEGK